MKALHGIVTPMVTPFGKDGKVDFGALDDLVDFLVQNGIHGIYPLGTTGECLFMAADERKQVAEAVVERAAGRVPVFVHVGAPTSAEAAGLAAHAARTGADGVAAVTPYYYQYSPRELVAYYEAILEAIPEGFPLYLYNIPSCTGNDLSPAVVRELAQRHPNVAGIKNSMGDIDRLRAYRQVRPGFSVLVGNDPLISAAYIAGCDGGVSGPSQIVPQLYTALYAALEAGDLATVTRTQRQVADVVDVTAFGHVPTIKALMRQRGLPGGYVRAPFLDLDDGEAEAAAKQLERILEAGSTGG